LSWYIYPAHVCGGVAASAFLTILYINILLDQPESPYTIQRMLIVASCLKDENHKGCIATSGGTPNITCSALYYLERTEGNDMYTQDIVQKTLG
jgi:hypothetical protein